MYNFLIRVLSRFGPKLDGDPNIWLERPWRLDPTYHDFRCGTCCGIYKIEDREFQVLVILNTDGGNGHFEKTLDWFKQSCLREKYNLSFLEISNPKLKQKLLKLGFVGDSKKITKRY